MSKMFHGGTRGHLGGWGVGAREPSCGRVPRGRPLGLLARQRRGGGRRGPFAAVGAVPSEQRPVCKHGLTPLRAGNTEGTIVPGRRGGSRVTRLSRCSPTPHAREGPSGPAALPAGCTVPEKGWPSSAEGGGGSRERRGGGLSLGFLLTAGVCSGSLGNRPGLAPSFKTSTLRCLGTCTLACSWGPRRCPGEAFGVTRV